MHSPTQARLFADVARTLESAADLTATLEAICRHAVEVIDGCEHAGITIVSPSGRFSTPAASDPVPERVDALQYELRQGPCVDAATRQGEVMLSNDLLQDETWPDFGPRAVGATGVRSMMSCPLHVDETTLGALNLYARRTGAFDERAVESVSILATHAALAFVRAQSRDRAENLSAALQTNRRIGVAVGVLMARHGLTESQAFELLRARSQEANRKLRDIADELVDGAVTPRPEEPAGPAPRTSPE